MADSHKMTLGAKVTAQEEKVFRAARGDIPQSEAIRLALKGWVERRGFKWPDYVVNVKDWGGDRRSQKFRGEKLAAVGPGETKNAPTDM